MSRLPPATEAPHPGSLVRRFGCEAMAGSIRSQPGERNSCEPLRYAEASCCSARQPSTPRHRFLSGRLLHLSFRLSSVHARILTACPRFPTRAARRENLRAGWLGAPAEPWVTRTRGPMRRSAAPASDDLRPVDGSRVGAVGSGLAGSSLPCFLLQAAERVGLALDVDLCGPRVFLQPAPRGGACWWIGRSCTGRRRQGYRRVEVGPREQSGTATQGLGGL